VPGAADDAISFLARHASTRDRFEKVIGLVYGFESPFGLELLSTVHWVMNHDQVARLEDEVQHTHGWSARKAQFTPRQIGLAVALLTAGGWATTPWRSSA